MYVEFANGKYVTTCDCRGIRKKTCTQSNNGPKSHLVGFVHFFSLSWISCFKPGPSKTRWYALKGAMICIKIIARARSHTWLRALIVRMLNCVAQTICAEMENWMSCAIEIVEIEWDKVIVLLTITLAVTTQQLLHLPLTNLFYFKWFLFLYEL